MANIKMANNNNFTALMTPVLSAILAGYIKLVYKTSRKIYEPNEYSDHIFAHHPFILGLWHGQFVMAPASKPPNLPVSIMVAKHSDGDVIAGALEHFGMKLIRGGGAGHRNRDRGGMRALRESVRALKDGATLGVTADVPPGPARKVGLGILTIARISGRPILPSATATSRFWALNSWSRMTLNMPFSTLAQIYGDPIYVPRDATDDELEKLRAHLENEMNVITERAYQLVGRSTDDIRPYTMSQTTSADAQTTSPPPIGLPFKFYAHATNLLRFTAPWILKNREAQHKEDPTRRNERMGRPQIPRPEGKLIWFHAASVGETNAILPLLPEIKTRRPDVNILLTTGTVTSARLARERLETAAIHQFIPLDVQKYMQNFLNHWRPDMAVIAESEIWPNLIIETESASIPLTLVNARMSKKTFRSWKRYSAISRPLFSRFNEVLAQTDRISDWYRILGAPNVRTSGNLKIDAPPPPVDADKRSALKEAIGTRPHFLAVSTHPGEDELIAKAHRKMARKIPGLLTILAPRHPERGIAISEEFGQAGLRSALRSKSQLPTDANDFYIADTIGELGTLYSLSPLAFIGGSLVPHGGQNPIEAIKHDSVVLTGPYTRNFANIYQTLLKADGAIEINSAEELAEIATNLLQNKTELDRKQKNAETGLSELTGALNETLQSITDRLAD